MAYSIDPLPKGQEQNAPLLHSRVWQLLSQLHAREERWWNRETRAADYEPDALGMQILQLDPQKFVAAWNSRWGSKYPLQKLESLPPKEVFHALLTLLEDG
jgi:hypothetical protein